MIRATTGGVLRSYRKNLMNSFINQNKARDTVLTQRTFNSYAEDPAAAARAFKLRKARMTVESQYSICTDTQKKYETGWTCLEGIDKLIDTKNGEAMNTLKGTTLKMLNDPTGDAREQLTKALESWSWQGCAGMPASVEVYARAYAVELFRNGKSVGRKRLKNTCRAVFKTAYADGELTAASYDREGKEIGRYSLTTAGAETVLQVTPEEQSVKPGGLAFVRLQYTDGQGVWKPMEKHTLKVSVEGGTLEGLGSANAYVEGNYAQDSTPTYYGEAMAVVRAEGSGPVRLTVRDETGEHMAELPCGN